MFFILIIHIMNYTILMIEMRHLQTLLALSETGNLSLAAKRVHLSQPAASHQIKALEDHLNTRLFDRKTHPLRFTQAGNSLLKLAHEIENKVRQTEKEIAHISSGKLGQLRIAVECHSCFDWLMPSMDKLRSQYPDIEMDLVSGFQPDPVGLLTTDQADFVIVSSNKKRPKIDYHFLFEYEAVALVAKEHPLATKKFLSAQEFASETLITYPIPDERLDIMREVLSPVGINPHRRTAMLTVAILQLVASRRGIAVLPDWAVEPYLEKGYVVGKPVGKKGLRCSLYAATLSNWSKLVYIQDFIPAIQKEKKRASNISNSKHS